MAIVMVYCIFFFSSRRRHTRCSRDWSSDVCSSDLRLGARLLDDLLSLLPEGVDRRLVDEPELLAVLRSDPVAAALPARSVEELIGAVDVELPPGVLRDEA